MSPRTRRTRSDRGFALVITLSLMVLLTIIAVGLLTLGTISLRSAGAGDAQAQAYANARLAVMMAIGQLQKQAGDDRRVTADNSILDKTAVDNSAAQSYAAGVWTSWSAKFDASPTQAATNYTTKKTDSFRGWLMSAPTPADLKKPDYPKSVASDTSVRLFTTDLNGFELSAPKVELKDGGTMAWVTTQENTKAKVTVDGPEKLNVLPVNAVVQAPPRPSLHAAVGLQNPKDGFSLRTNKVVSLNQIRLDEKLAGGNATEVQKVGTSYTVYSQGLMTDAVNGGLKTDLSLGFEMTDADWAKPSWGSTTNPFRRTTLPYKDNSNNSVNIPTSFSQQVPLFRPLPGLENPIVSVDVPYDVANVSQKFYAAGVPTFDHLRSFYRIPRYLYGGTGSSVTVPERSADHIASRTTGGAGYTPSPSKPFNTSSTTRRSVTSIKPVLNRMVYLFSMKLSSDDKVRVVITPIISLWNPYNTALDIEGAVAYPWIDVPFQLNWNINRPGGTSSSANLALSRMMGYQFEGAGHGRQVNPYFLCQITADGTKDINNKAIHFEPGEVRVFAPATTLPVEYNRTANDPTSKVIWMRPVDTPNQFTTQGGLVVKMDGGVGGDGNGFVATMGATDTATLNMTPSNNGGAYHYFVSLEDATRIRTPVNLNLQGGVATQDVEMLNFISTYTTAQSPVMTYGALKQPKPAPFAVVETFQRTATSDVVGAPGCDLVFTMNPRNPATSHVLAPAISGNVPRTAPHYQATMRGVTDFAQALQVTSDGRRSFWGASHSSSGSSILPFFDLPREPMLSLAGFQSADLSSSAYGASCTIGNSMASAWLRRTIVARQQPNLQTGGVQVSTLPIYDTTYLGNELLWDGYFFSGAAALTSPGTRPSNLQTAYDPGKVIASETKSVAKVVEDWVKDPDKNPLGNARMRLHQGSAKQSDLIKDLGDPAGCAVMAAHVMLDGAFNINSTDKAAWIAVLASLRGQAFDLQDGGNAPASDTSFPRMRHPTGSANGTWNGFRTLTDAQIEGLAKEIVSQVKQRGPFQSVGEFVNRRVENTELGRCGAIQAAIDALKLNTSMLKTSFLPTFYPSDAQTNLVKFTEAGIPGFLQQGDVMQGLGSMITCRSDTFVIRGYGEAKDAKGNVTAKAWCEAVVQRMPEFVDANADAPQIPVASLRSDVNKNFGRRFEIVSIRRIPRPEAVGTGSLASAP